MARHLPSPPSDITGPLGQWLREVHRVVEALPNVSIASFGATDTPNSRVTGTAGNLCINIGSASTDSRLWVLGGGATASALTDQGWALVRIVR